VDLPARARAFAAEAYEDQGELEHPLEVARLVRSAGSRDEVVAAAVLHDLIEDTDVSIGEIAAEFGSAVAAMVSTMTEDESISGYTARKQEHRERACAAGPEASLIFVADKLSNARRMGRAQKSPDARKIGHYASTLELMRETQPDLALLDVLAGELEALRASLQRTPA
jgi:(p)ppGpp synthase/HD superfamily hydrolase